MKLEQYLAERNAAFESLNIDWAIRQAPYMSREVAEIALHKGRYECVTMPPALRHESAMWLRERGFKRMSGDEILSDDELPT